MKSPFLLSLTLVWISFTLFIWNAVLAADGKWSAWSPWTQCSSSCGDGTRQRRRFCNNPSPTDGGKRCEGERRQKTPCSASIICPVHGDWGEWTAWTDCSISCGEGSRSRFRECDSPRPQGGGKPCEGSSEETQTCFGTKQCPRDGKWSSWSEWSQCSVTCDSGGTRHRYRSCNNPPPFGGGAPCPGTNHDVKKCRVGLRCAINGQWSEWSGWTACSATCGSGETRRWRKCDNPAPEHGGKDCDCSEAGETQIRSCNGSIVFCAVNGGWSDWSDWGDCNTPDCSAKPPMGYSYRQRSCIKPFPAHGGSMCQGTFLQAGSCQGPANCPVDGGWSEWSAWSCTQFVGIHTRECNNPPPSGGGKKCLGDFSEDHNKVDEPKKYHEICPNVPEEKDDEEMSGSGSGAPFDDDSED